MKGKDKVEKTLKPAVAYVRMSSDKQEASPQQQRDAINRLAKADGFAEMRIETSFQSRFGRAQWLEPATDDTLIAEGEKGTKRLAVTAPGFSADCVETLEELAIEGRDQFRDAGGEKFAVLSCLNASDAGMQMLESILRRELSGWI